MVDNFELVKPLLKFENPGDFYYLQILRRPKDGNSNVPNGGSNSHRNVKDFNVTSIDELDGLKSQIIGICESENARAYLRLNKRNFKDITFALASEILDQIRHQHLWECEINETENINLNGIDFGLVSNIFNDALYTMDLEKSYGNHSDRFHTSRRLIASVIGKNHSAGKDDKTWIVDIDDTEIGSELVDKVKEIIGKCEPFDVEKVVATIPTKSGVHLIVKPLNVMKFNEMVKGIGSVSEIDIKKDNPTVLYCC